MAHKTSSSQLYIICLAVHVLGLRQNKCFTAYGFSSERQQVQNRMRAQALERPNTLCLVTTQHGHSEFCECFQSKTKFVMKGEEENLKPIFQTNAYAALQIK